MERTLSAHLFGGLAITLLLVSPSVLSARSDSASLAAVEISPYLLSAVNLPIHGELVLRLAGAQNEPARRVPLSSLTPVALKLPADTAWEVSADLPGFWVPPKTLRVGSAAEIFRLSLGLWPKGTISGIVRIKEKGLKFPRVLLVQTLEAPAFLHRPAVPPGALDCPIDEKGAWSCSLPAATFDLVLSSEGFTPQYRWQAQVSAGQTLSLGTLVLERGASVAGWAAVEGGAIEEGKCIARLAPLLSGGASLEESIQLERTAIERPVHRDGFFQLARISPGTYALEVRQPGYSPARFSPVRVETRAETLLREPLVLSHPLDLAFAIDPPLDWLGRPWHAKVSRARESERLAPLVFDGAVAPDGHFTVSGQAAGRFAVTVADSLDNRLYSTDDVRLDGPGTPPVPIEVKLIEVAGRLRFGREPVAGTLWFGGRNGTARVKMAADAEGRFLGVLPRGGAWLLEIESTSPLLRLRTVVEVASRRSGKASVDVDLPNTRLFGRVLDERGRPAPRAEVLVEGRDPLQPTETDEAGDFEIRGLREGSAQVSAAADSRTSESLSVTLVDGREAGPVELRLRKVEKWSGAVLSSRGPVAGARVIVQPVPIMNGAARGTTGKDGSFTVEMPAGVRQGILYVMAPGFPLQAFGPVERTALTLQLSERGGDLTISLPGGDDFQRQDLGLAAFLNRLPLPFGMLRQWAVEQGEPRLPGATSRVPSVMAGEYRLCVVARERVEAVLASGDPGAGATCDSGLLAAGATLALRPESQ